MKTQFQNNWQTKLSLHPFDVILETRMLDRSCSTIFFTIHIQDTFESASRTYAKVTVKMDNIDVSISKPLAMALKSNVGSSLDHFKLGDLSVDLSRQKTV